MHYDLIILGGGPAGLSLASELGKKISILLIDEGALATTHKIWTSEEFILKKTGYTRFIGARFSQAYVQAYNGQRRSFNLKYCTIDEKKILQHWKQKCTKQGVTLMSFCRYQQHKMYDSHISVKTTKGTFTADYIIDCMGVDSPIVRHHKLWQHLLYIPIFGEVIKYKSLPDEIVVAESLEPQRVSFFEMFPVTNEISVIYSFFISKKRRQLSSLKSLHHYNKLHSPVAEKIKKIKPIHEVYGTIPVGILKEKPIKRIMFFGDAALLGTCALATGFSKILLHANPFAHYVRRVLKNKEELPPRYFPSCAESINAQLQLLFLMILHYGSHKDLDDLYTPLSQLSYKQRLHFTFALATVKDDVEVFKKLVVHIPPLRIMKILPLASSAFLFQSLARFIDTSLQSGINKAFHRVCPRNKLSQYVACKQCMCLICKCYGHKK